MRDEQFKQQHPVMNEVAQTYVDLYTYRPDEKTRQQLIKREALLHDKLEQILAERAP
ncbi:hypothetical protein [Marinobacter xestospongiae]|uniref:Uncharacterized protein n=1 Tax=Marinobacter xestospongiae TaxID=994319 RepID=A0ABU3VUE4_9GAMM|nr:hypothetical protein [Marinobacter xestospongiae]MDV2077884.1 hypothetical protein [Marinobacter xestospongiae]